MKNIHSNPTPLRQKFIEYLTLNRKAERTVHCYVSFIHSLAKFYHRSPELLSSEELQHWLYHLIAERKQAPSTVNLAICPAPHRHAQSFARIAKASTSVASRGSIPPANACSLPERFF